MTPLTAATAESVRQAIMTYEVASGPSGMWTIQQRAFAGLHPFILFASSSPELIIMKLREIMLTDISHGAGSYAENLGNGHFRQMAKGMAERNAPVKNILLDSLEIDL